jgi:uncharacterized protein with HEPN domain
MSRHEFRVRDYLEHMAEAVRRVAEYTDGKSEQQFLANRLMQDAVMRNFEVLGEAANNCFKVSPNIAVQYPELPFAKIYRLRNQLTHGYWTVDLEILWKVIEKDVPELQKQIALVLESLDGSPDAG